MDNSSTPLQFTVSDRDMLRDTYQGVKAILEKQEDDRRDSRELQERVADLERLRDEGSGVMRTMKMLWAIVGALAGFFGWHISGKH